MIRSQIFVILLFVTFGFTACKSAGNDTRSANSRAQQYVKNSLIICYDPQIGKAELLKKISEYGAVAKYQYSIINAVAITFPKNKSVSEAEAYFKKIKGVLQVQKDYIQSAN